MENGRRSGFQDMLVGFSKVYQCKLKQYFCKKYVVIFKTNFIECQICSKKYFKRCWYASSALQIKLKQHYCQICCKKYVFLIQGMVMRRGGKEEKNNNKPLVTVHEEGSEERIKVGNTVSECFFNLGNFCKEKKKLCHQPFAWPVRVDHGDVRLLCYCCPQISCAGFARVDRAAVRPGGELLRDVESAAWPWVGGGGGPGCQGEWVCQEQWIHLFHIICLHWVWIAIQTPIHPARGAVQLCPMNT